MLHTAIFPGRYLQGAGALSALPEELSKLGQRPLVIASGSARREVLPQIASALTNAVVESFGGECTDEEIERLTGIARQNQCDVVVAIGGGKALDTGKSVGHAANARTVMIPTIASTDAPCSAVAVVYTAEGAYKRYLFFPRNPDLVLVDTAVIARAPLRFLVAGMGDALSTWFEADACRQAYAPNQAGGLATQAALALARLCYDTIREFGVAASQSCARQVVTPALEHVVEANTLLSGLGFESAGLASAHSIHNGLTKLPGTHDYYHGEKVAIGVLAGLFLADRPVALIDEVYAFCEAIGLPTTLAEIGLPAPTESELREVAIAACAEGETIHHEPSPITAERVYAAVIAADAYGCKRKGRACS